MKSFYLIILAFISSSAALAQHKADTLFYESFNGKTIDRSKWNVEVTGYSVNNEQQAYVDSTDELGLINGALVIKPVFHPGYVSKQKKQFDFLSGRINSRANFEFIYGTASARIKMSAGDGLWPAFWLMGDGKWPDTGEIDVMENIGDASWVSHAMHGPGYSGNTPLLHRSVFPKGTDITQWHVYSVTWSANSVIFKIDNETTYTVTRAMVEHYGKWAYDNSKFIVLNYALGGDYPISVNKASLPYHGLPQTTVDKIKAGQASMQVDWILVTK
jgi:beta-glucanase (GH16 family)